MTEEEGMLKVDSEFRRLVLPYTRKEYAALEQQILNFGCSQPIVVWYGYIIQGFEQYEICTTNGIIYEVKNINFCVREEAISLVCQEELRNRFLPENQRRYLIGKRYNADRIIGAHNAAGTDQFKERVRRELSKGKKFYESSIGRTREKLAGEYHLNKCSVARYSVYARAIDYIASIEPEIVNRILAGKMKISMEAVMACYGKTEKEVEKYLRPSGKNDDAETHVLAEKEIGESASVKDMPVFDPDAEIDSLALTIPSWTSSINRTCITANFSLLTPKGKNRLKKQLYQLQEAIQVMLYALEEVN